MARTRARPATVWHLETTFPDPKTAERVTARVLQERLAACAQRYPVQSLYWWRGEIEDAKESLVMFKTSHGRVRLLEQRIEELHPYEIPYIAATRLGRINEAYARWVEDETRG